MRFYKLSIVLISTVIFFSFTISSALAIKFESGTAATHNTISGLETWDTVTLLQNYDTVPMIFVMASDTGGNSCTVRVRNVTLGPPTTFEMCAVEPENWDGHHLPLTVDYMAIEQGVHLLPNGDRIYAIAHNTQTFQDGNGTSTGWDTIDFLPFDALPIIVAQVQTDNNEIANPPVTGAANPKPWLTAAVDDVTNIDFKIALERSQCNDGDDGAIATSETIGIIIMEGNLTGSFVDNGSNTILYGTVRTPAVIDGWDDGWDWVNFPPNPDGPYTNPLVLATKNTRNENDGGWLRRSNVTTTQVQLTVDEDRDVDNERNHAGESAGLLVFSDPTSSGFSTVVPAGEFTTGRRALDFDGTDDHVEVNDDPSLDLSSQGTIEAWVYMFGTSGNAGIVHKGDGATNEAYSLRFGGANNDQVQLVVNDGATTDSVTSNTSLSPNVWYHVAGTWEDTANMAIYINGIQDNTAACGRSAVNSSEKLIIGAQDDTGASPFHGVIDEVRIWNDVRTETEIRDYMCKKWTGVEAHLMAYWRFDEEVGTTCIDLSQNGNSGTMTDMDPATDRICSSAPIGDASAWDYTGTGAAAPKFQVADFASGYGDKMTITEDGGDWDPSLDSCLHVYRVDNTPLYAGNPFLWKGFNSDSAPYYWGVFKAGGTDPTYEVGYTYTGHPIDSNENSLDLAFRNKNCGNWKDGSALLDAGNDTLTKSYLSGTEFILGSKVEPRNTIDYDGVDDYVEVTDLTQLQLTTEGTLEAWIYPESFATGAGIVFKGTANSDYGFGLAGQAVGGVFPGGTGQNIGFRVNGTTTVSSTALSADRWYHVACSWRNPGNMRIYINGVQDANLAGANTSAPGNAENLRFGMQNITPSYFHGRIDEIRIWNYLLGVAQIQTNMCKKLTGSEANLMGYWRFDQESTSRVCPDYDFGTKNTAYMYATGFGNIIDARICSSAPIGDDSSYDYTGTPYSTQLAHSDGDYLFATNDGGSWANTFSGLHIYRVDEAPVYPPDIGTSPYLRSPNGLTPPATWSSIDYYRYWGVFLTDWSTVAQPQYDVVYHYGSNSSTPVDDSYVALAKRPAYCFATWSDSLATLNTVAKTLTLTNQTQNGPPKTNPEYILGGTTGPLAIVFVSFSATACEDKQCISVEWETATEIDTVGFYVWRSTSKNGDYIMLPGMIATKAAIDTTGASYVYLDYDVDPDQPATYYYRIEEVDTNNNWIYQQTAVINFPSGNAGSSESDDQICFIGSLTLR